MQVLEGYTFWEWFCEHQERYAMLFKVEADERAFWVQQLNDVLHRYCKGLFADFDLREPEAKMLVITALGDERYFEQAEELVLMAPQLEDWEIVALWPEAEEDDYPVCCEWEGLLLRSDELWFSMEESRLEPQLLGVFVYFKDYNPNRETVYFEAARWLLDLLLGEKNSRLDVPRLGVAALPENWESDGIFELEDLPEFIYVWKEQVKLN